MRGKIVKGIAGFYYVHVEEDGEGAVSGIYECRAKGGFRRDRRKPLVGDNVEMKVLDREKLLGSIVELLPRQNELIRPAVANVSQALVIFSVVKPEPNFNLLDRFLVMMGRQGIPCVICFNKTDLDGSAGEYYGRIYEDGGFRVIRTSAAEGEGIGELREALAGRTTAVAGPSGVGKSSLVNCLQSEVVMKTGQISEKIQRGKHTTRHSELIAAGKDTYILDTPGFSSLGLFDLKKEELLRYYPEFAMYETYCRFGGCTHISEPECGVKDAVDAGKICKMRYENYRLLYEELKEQKRY